ncbi:MAG: TrkA family potassium uptake protein [Victivallaceae bacterium]|nr:TrkA family potassium uptake protein [Victivallaceae bacterium]
MKNTFAVIGLGTFGSKLALELSQAGHSVVVIDRTKALINDIKDKVAEAIIADVTNSDTVREIDVRNFDAVIFGMSSHFEDLILALTLVKQEGAKKIIAKANTDLQKRILLRLGADEVIQPDQDVAERLSRRLSMNNISDMFAFKGSTIAEVKVPASLSGKTIRDLDMRRKHNISILLLKKPGKEVENIWNPDVILEEGDELTILGEEKNIVNVFQN